MTDITAISDLPAVSTQRPWLGWTMAILSTAAFSLAPTVGKAAIGLGIDPIFMLTLRLISASLLLGLTILLTAPERLTIDRRGLWVCIAAGGANGVGMVTFFLSLTRIDSSVASMIFSLSPVVLLALLALRGEPFTWRNTLRLVLGLIGVYLLIGPGGRVDGLGILLALGAVFTVPIQIMLMQWYLQDYDSRTVTLYMVATMAVVAGVWWLVQGIEWQPLGGVGWALLGVLTLVSTYFARLAMFVAVRYIGGGEFGLLAPLETFLTVIWSLLFLGERLRLVQWLGGSLILLSATLASNFLILHRREKV
jgi:DME family drug/metabolite transporter